MEWKWSPQAKIDCRHDEKEKENYPLFSQKNYSFSQNEQNLEKKKAMLEQWRHFVTTIFTMKYRQG